MKPMPPKPSGPRRSKNPVAHRLTVLNVTEDGGRLRVNARAYGEDLSITMDARPTDSDAAIRARVEVALRCALGERAACARQAARVTALLQGQTIDVPRPLQPYASVGSGRLQGHVRAHTARLLARIRTGVVEREIPVEPNRNGWFHVDLGGAELVSLTPVSADGVYGDTYDDLDELEAED